MFRTLPVLAFLVLLLDSCNVSGAEVNTAVEADGSGQFELGVGYLLDEDEEVDCTADADAPPGSTAFVEQRGAETWCVLHAPFASLPKLRSLYTALLKEALRVHCLALEDERLIYDLEIVTGESSGDSEGGTIYWSVTAPGEISSSNADTIDGSRLTWTITSLESPLRFRINAPEGEVCPSAAVRLLLNLNEDGSGSAGLRAPLSGDEERDEALAGQLQTSGWSIEFGDAALEGQRTWESEAAFAAVLASIPGLAGSSSELTLTQTEDEATSQRTFDLRGRLDFSGWASAWPHPLPDGGTTPFIFDYLPAGTIETVSGGWTATGPLTLVYTGEGAAGIPLRAVSVLQPELEVPIDPDLTEVLLEDLSASFVQEIPVGQVRTNPTLIQNALGVVFAPGTVNNMTNWTTFACGDYQTRVIQWLDSLRTHPDPLVRAQLAGIDYGPIQAYSGGHQAVVVFPRGTDWRETGTVYDPWPNQRPEVWAMKRWTDRFTWGVDVGEGARQYPHLFGNPSHYAGTEIPHARLHSRRIAVNSPVAVLIVANDGRRVGMLEDGEFVYEIEGVDFYPTPRSNGEVQWYFGLPEGSYQVRLTGTASGEVHVLVGDEAGQLVTYGAQAIGEAETAELEVDPQGLQAPLAFARGEVEPLVVTDDNVASIEFGEALLVATERPAAPVRWAYLGLLGVACLVPAGAMLVFITLRLTRRGAG